MLLVIASRHDQPALGLVERWRDLDARLMSCRDLSRAGWRYLPGDPVNSQAIIGEEVVPFNRITGVLTCAPMMTESELVHIAPADRSYVSAEMTAFLTGWLSTATFPVINRPTPNCLMGPCWSQTRWIHEGARAGLRTRVAEQALARRGYEPDPAIEPGRVSVAVVGDRCFGETAAVLAKQSKQLALTAGVESLTVVFSGPDSNAEFLHAYLGVDLAQRGVADALLDCFSVPVAAVA